jgi:hypothetical protein
VTPADDRGMSAQPSLPATSGAPSEPRIVAFPGTALSVVEAAAAIGVAESTLRRHLKLAAEAQASETDLRCEFRGRVFSAIRKAPRTPWRIVLEPRPAGVDAATLRYEELRVAMLPLADDRALEHTPDRPWWKFWARRA